MFAWNRHRNRCAGNVSSGKELAQLLSSSFPEQLNWIWFSLGWNPQNKIFIRKKNYDDLQSPFSLCYTVFFNTIESGAYYFPMVRFIALWNSQWSVAVKLGSYLYPKHYTIRIELQIAWITIIYKIHKKSCFSARKWHHTKWLFFIKK